MTYVIYSITHRETQTQYFGMTRDDRLHLIRTKWGFIPFRYSEHLHSLRRGDHYNKALLQVWTGNADDFSFNIVEVAGPDMKAAHEREKHHMRSAHRVFNHRHIQPFRGIRATPAVCKAVMTMFSNGLNGKQIATRTGLSTASVSLIKNRNGAPARKYLKEKV